MRTILLISILFSHALMAQDDWLLLGEQDHTWGYKTPYRISLYVPKGVHDLDDIKKGLQMVKFELMWLAPETPQEQVKQHFIELINSQMPDEESIYANQGLLSKFTKKLSMTKRHEKWFFVYSPDSGTNLYIEGKYTHKIIGSQINRALYTAWLLDKPMTTAKLLSRLLKQG